MAACQALQEGNEQQELQPYDVCDPAAYRIPVLLPRQASSAPLAMSVAPPKMSSSLGSGRSATEARALKIHSEAERRRRGRINAHLATLKRMIPDTTQMDKSALLARVVDQVKALRRKASEATQGMPLPPETNEVTIECYTGGDSGGAVGTDKILYIKASISCDDRPDLIAGLIQAFHGLRLRTVRADMTSLGGRVQHVFILCKEQGWGSEGASIRSLKEAVRQALAKVASPEMVYGSSPFQSKRQRILESHYSIRSI
ncbi:transcription factor bHLH30-like [Phragmites australis]|uniref:transcription factor bHLH30-like n=1 Tax=Phragmites australis TaxID=29695 RepID=UPI002D793603|nr:transcription factor bHLH30-like [Phragmites australis]XP_062183102.1 transcription factor bHLH30-like [Phragmites australis]XP_062183109.1 transcription factor bHLH30-like [Phragmites australis]XP_062183116.1 transcription factor bHLH30-like [Phragmites australis]